MSSTEPQRTRRTAEERRVDVLDAALIEFAIYGLHGASTEAIAERAGISQPYVLRLFGTKKALFLETVAMARGMIEHAWKRALVDLPADLPPERRLAAMGDAFQALTDREHVLRVLLQAYSAAADPEVREQCQWAMAEMFGWIRRETGVSGQAAQQFFAAGMLIMVGTSIGAPARLDAEWARAFMMQDVDGTDT
jgi:AcrR family transcriptional regulator